MLPSSIRLVVLDCDGVLFDSARANVEFYNEVLRRMGLPGLVGDLERFCHYSSSRQLFERLFASDPVRFEEAVAVSRSVDYTPFYSFMTPVPRLTDTLAALKRGRSLAMATNRTRTGAEVVRIFRLEPWIEFVSTVGPEVRAKPEPDVLVRCLAHFDVRGEEAVYVGDAESDRVAAERAGMHFVGVGDVPGAARRVSGLGDVLELLADPAA